MKIIPILALSAFLLISCKNETATENKVDGTEQVDEHAGHNHDGHDHDGHDHDGHDHGTNGATTETTNGESPKLNPPHGEPGHRCEIPVGAPLDGSATSNSQPAPAAAPAGHFLNNGGKSANTATENPYTVSGQNAGNNEFKKMDMPQAQPAAQVTAPGMKGKPNPAHGQPGHRCDVQVGQPLP